MGKQIDNLRCIIGDLQSRYGKEDADVQILQAKLSTMVASEEAAGALSKASITATKLGLKSLAKQHLGATQSGDLLNANSFRRFV